MERKQKISTEEAKHQRERKKEKVITATLDIVVHVFLSSPICAVRPFTYDTGYQDASSRGGPKVGRHHGEAWARWEEEAGRQYPAEEGDAHQQ